LPEFVKYSAPASRPELSAASAVLCEVEQLGATRGCGSSSFYYFVVVVSF